MLCCVMVGLCSCRADCLATEQQQAGGGCLLPVLLERKAHAQISQHSRSQAQGSNRMDDVNGKKSVCADDQACKTECYLAW